MLNQAAKNSGAAACAIHHPTKDGSTDPRRSAAWAERARLIPVFEQAGDGARVTVANSNLLSVPKGSVRAFRFAGATSLYSAEGAPRAGRARLAASDNGLEDAVMVTRIIARIRADGIRGPIRRTGQTQLHGYLEDLPERVREVAG